MIHKCSKPRLIQALYSAAYICFPKVRRNNIFSKNKAKERARTNSSISKGSAEAMGRKAEGRDSGEGQRRLKGSASQGMKVSGGGERAFQQTQNPGSVPGTLVS